MSSVLDAHPLMIYLEREPGYEKARDLFAKAAASGRHLLMTTVNWGEVYYVTYRDQGKDRAEEIEALVENFPIEIVPVDHAIARQAAIFKATTRMSYADCFAAALAKLRRAELITGDKDFRQVEDAIKVYWL